MRDANGNRLAPRYNHHVDDNMYGDISEYMERAAAASVISLYEILGYPDGSIPDPISWDKFSSSHGHKRRVVGWELNTRTLTFSLPSDKRAAIVELLKTWLSKTEYTLLNAAELHGKLADASRANRKGRAQFFAFQNAIRRALHLRFTQVRGYYKRKGKEHVLRAQLPKHLHSRINSLIAKDMATLLWTTSSKIKMTPLVHRELVQVYEHLRDPSKIWEMQIGHVIPRDATFTSIGDACTAGGGAFCDELQFWFDTIWSPRTRAALIANQLHINVMEFVVVLLQLAAVITIAEEHELYEPLRQLYPSGIPTLALSAPTTPPLRIGLTKSMPSLKRATTGQRLRRPLRAYSICCPLQPYRRNQQHYC